MSEKTNVNAVEEVVNVEEVAEANTWLQDAGAMALDVAKTYVILKGVDLVVTKVVCPLFAKAISGIKAKLESTATETSEETAETVEAEELVS